MISLSTRAGRELEQRQIVQVVVIGDLADEPLEVVLLLRETCGRSPSASSSMSLLNRSDTPGKAIVEPTCGARAKSSHWKRSCRSSRASGPLRVALGA